MRIVSVLLALLLCIESAAAGGGFGKRVSLQRAEIELARGYVGDRAASDAAGMIRAAEHARLYEREGVLRPSAIFTSVPGVDPEPRPLSDFCRKVGSPTLVPALASIPADVLQHRHGSQEQQHELIRAILAIVGIKPAGVRAVLATIEGNPSGANRTAFHRAKKLANAATSNDSAMVRETAVILVGVFASFSRNTVGALGKKTVSALGLDA